jgi:hypothetical protein
MKRYPLVVVMAVLLAGAATLVPVSIVAVKATTIQVLWHEDEALLFMGQNLIGWRISYFKWGLAKISPFGVPSQDLKRSMTVLRITPSRVDRRDIQGSLPPDLTVVDGHVAAYDGRPWNGDRFEFDSHLGPAPGRSLLMPRFSDVDGWTKQSMVLSRDAHFGIDIVMSGRKARLLFRNDGTQTIDLDRGGGSPERIWSADAPRQVSGAEYERMFGRQ